MCCEYSRLLIVIYCSYDWFAVTVAVEMMMMMMMVGQVNNRKMKKK